MSSWVVNRSAYINIVTGYEPPSPDGERHLALIIALEIGDDKDEMKKKDLTWEKSMNPSE